MPDSDSWQGVSIGERLRWAREQAGLSQSQVAKMMNVHRPTVSNIEAGDRSVRAEEVCVFAELYEVSPDWILGVEKDENENEVIQLIARELRKLGDDDLNSILQSVRTLQKRAK